GGAAGVDAAGANAALELAPAPLEGRVGELVRHVREEAREAGDRARIATLHPLRTPVGGEEVACATQRGGSRRRAPGEEAGEEPGRDDATVRTRAARRRPGAVGLLRGGEPGCGPARDGGAEIARLVEPDQCGRRARESGRLAGPRDGTVVPLTCGE